MKNDDFSVQLSLFIFFFGESIRIRRKLRENNNTLYSYFGLIVDFALSFMSVRLTLFNDFHNHDILTKYIYVATFARVSKMP